MSNAKFELFNRFVGNKLIILSDTGCWVWKGANIHKYVYIQFQGKGRNLAKLSNIVFNNGNPKLFTLHKCDIEGCCNPDHLYSGTAAENSDDMRYRRRNKIPKGVVIPSCPERPKPAIPPEWELEFPDPELEETKNG